MNQIQILNLRDPPGAWAFWTCRLGAGLSPQRLREECMNFLALALVCGASASFCTGVGVKLADAQSAHIEELVEERVLPLSSN